MVDAENVCIVRSSVKRMLNVGVRGKQLVHCRGPRLNRDTKEKSSVVYGNDKRLHLRVTPAMPQLEVHHVLFSSVDPVVWMCNDPLGGLYQFSHVHVVWRSQAG